MACFEFRLWDPEPAADFALPIWPDNPLQQFYVRLGEQAPPGSPVACLGEFLGRLPGAASGLPSTDWLSGIMLEYDVAELPIGASPAPGIFIKLHPESRQCSTPAAMTAALGGAAGWDDRGEGHAAERVFAALPPDAVVTNLGAMPERETRAIRLGLSGDGEPGQLAELLARMEWPGRSGKVADALADMRPAVSRFGGVHLDISGEGMLPRLGVSSTLRRDGGGWPRTESGGWRPAVERLTELGWCLPEKGAGLLAYPGFHRLYDDRGAFVLYKYLNHLKLSIQGDGVEAKAYVGLTFRRFEPAP